MERGTGNGERTIIVVVANNHLLNLPKLAHLAPEVLVKSIEVILQLTRIHLVFRIVGRVLVEVGEEDRLAVGGLDVFSRTAVAMPACADLVVEGAVYFVGFGTKDAGEVVGHCEYVVESWGEFAAEKLRLRD